MNHFKLRTLLTLISIFLVSQGFSTHIRGGEMSYKCIGSYQIEIKLTVYNDCDTRLPAADYSAVIGLFDAFNHTLIKTINVVQDPIKIKYVNLDSNIACNWKLCVVKTTYTDTVSLRYWRNTGCIFAYQRCCRGTNVSNLINSNDQGMTVSLEITPEALRTCNNSPTFLNPPPMVSHISDSMEVAVTAIDEEGDNLFYSLHAPFIGGGKAVGYGPNSPKPDTLSFPPYDTVTYWPSFSSNQPFDSSIPIEYGARSGILKAIPKRTGTFSVGYKLLEYSPAGEKLTALYRNMNISVGVCKVILDSAFVTGNPVQVTEAYTRIEL